MSSTGHQGVETLHALRERVRAAWTPNMDEATAARWRTAAVEVDELLEEASIQAQRADHQAAATAAALRRSRMWFVHPSGHFGHCPDTRSMLQSEADLRAVAGSGVWHLDPSQKRPDWWPVAVLADAPPGG